MKKYIPIFLLYLFSILISQYSFSQNLDSLRKIYNNKSQPDTNRLKAINDIAWSLRYNNPDTAIILAQQQLQLADNTNQKKYQGKAYNIIGVSYASKGNFPKALEFDLKSLKIREEIGDKKGIGNSYNNIGIVYFSESDYAKALEYYFNALKIWEELKEKRGMGNCYTNIGLVYQYQTHYEKALEYDLKGLQIWEDIGDKQGIGASYINIGNVYNFKPDYQKALTYYLKAVKIKEEISDKQGIGVCFLNLSEVYCKLLNLKLAVLYADSAVHVNKEIGDINQERLSYGNLSDIYFKMQLYKEAYQNHLLFKQLTDSIFNSDNSKQLGDLKTKFEVEKKEAELKIKSDAEQEKLKAVSLEEKKRQNAIIYAVAGVLLLVIVFSLFLYNRFRITHKQKEVIEKQKVLVDKAYAELHEKNKEVIDSINYASKIQRALITSEKYIDNQLNKLMNSQE